MSAATLPRKRRGYSREDVAIDYHGHGYDGHRRPMVNVKCHLWENGNAGSWPDAVLHDVAEDCGEDPARFVAWWRHKAEERTGEGWNDGTALGELVDGREGYGWRSEAAGDAFESAGEDAAAIFGEYPRPKVYAEGRSGGWLVVDGLPSVDTWDAVALGRWRRFERYVRAAVDDFPRAVAWLVCANTYRAEREAEDAERARQIERGRAIVGAWADRYAEAAS